MMTKESGTSYWNGLRGCRLHPCALVKILSTCNKSRIGLFPSQRLSSGTEAKTPCTEYRVHQAE